MRTGPMLSSSERQPNACLTVGLPVRFTEDASGKRLLTKPRHVAVIRCPRGGAADAGTPGRVSGEIGGIPTFAVEDSSEVPLP